MMEGWEKKDDKISRAAAIEALSTPCDKRYRHGVWETCLDNIETAIRNIPAVEAAPVVHGRWEKSSEFNGYCCCSVCHDVYIDPDWIANGKWSYCPNCGAKMDKNGKEKQV